MYIHRMHIATTTDRQSVDQTTLRAVSLPQADNRLRVEPSTAVGLLLSDRVVHIGVSCRLGTAACRPRTCPCGSIAYARGLHVLSSNRAARGTVGTQCWTIWWGKHAGERARIPATYIYRNPPGSLESTTRDQVEPFLFREHEIIHTPGTYRYPTCTPCSVLHQHQHQCSSRIRSQQTRSENSHVFWPRVQWPIISLPLRSRWQVRGVPHLQNSSVTSGSE